MSDKASKLYDKLLETYFGEYYDLLDAKRSKMDPKYDPANLTLNRYGYREWYKKSDDEKKLETYHH